MEETSNGSAHVGQCPVPRYKMTSDPRGICLIINNKNFKTDASGVPLAELQLSTRHGTDIDKEKLRSTFRALKFEVHVYDDTTDACLLKILTGVSLKDHSRYDCFVFCVLSHGDLGVVYGSNGVPVEIRKLTERLCPQSCPSLSGKPKVFIIQACQGSGIQRGHPDTETDVVLEQEKLIPGEADFLLAYSTVPGYVSFRDKTNGSHYIDKLVEILKKHAHELDILKILTLVNHELGCRDIFKEGDGHCKQSPAQLSTLRKDLYLSPIQLSSESIATAVPRFPDNEVRMALIGKTGNGKSSSGNTIFGVDKFPVCRGWGSCGDSCGWGLVEREGLRIQVADTPGLCDTERPQREVNRDIAECVRKTTPGPHVFLMVLNYATRFTEEEWKAYCDLKLLFGRDFNKHMIVLITHFDEVDDMGVCFEDELKNAPQNLQQIIAEAGGRYVVFNNVAGRDDRCQQSGRLLDMVADLIAANGGAFYSLRGLDSNGVVKDSSKKLSKKFGKGRGDRSSGKCSAM